jgi:hypothetical protein
LFFRIPPHRKKVVDSGKTRRRRRGKAEVGEVRARRGCADTWERRKTPRAAQGGEGADRPPHGCLPAQRRALGGGAALCREPSSMNDSGTFAPDRSFLPHRKTRYGSGSRIKCGCSKKRGPGR